ncbi:hypothetical protein CDN99_20590 [Roseateles aquatilis]|uniref:Nucleotidyltransferase n=1 Tax=Roseateles aquatilis TaxID=431061 RepID=A0A246J0Y4_9BURK|nr:nucleotidyltransferase family protein [Roseateles aquatilis]OWQ86236.1 hypothetical protein CDN99_20590 [Roseateles aquatilis]
MDTTLERDASAATEPRHRLARWHAELSETAAEARPSDARLAAATLARTHVALLSLVPALREGTHLGPLKPMAAWIRAALIDTSVDSLHHLADGDGTHPAQRTYQRMAEAQARCAAEVSTALRDQGIVPLLFKGVELRPRAFGGRAISSSTDVDLLVRPADIERARGILQGLGFVHARYDPAAGRLVEVPREKTEAHEKTHRELYPLCRLAPVHLEPDEIEFVRAFSPTPLFVHDGQGLLMEVIDLHRGLFVRMEVDSLFERAVPSLHAGAVTLSLTDHVWTTALRFYLESSTVHNDPKQRDLAYLAALLSLPGIDWPALVKLVSAADLRPALFYSLRLLSRLQIAAVPAWVLDELHVRRGSHYMDFGCRATRMLGLVEGLPPEIDPLVRQWP